MNFRDLIKFGRTKPASAAPVKEDTPTAVTIPDTPDTTAKKAFHVGDLLMSLVSIDETYNNNPLLRQYLGEYRKQPTYFRGDGPVSLKGPETPVAAPDFTQMMTGLHKVYRSRLPMLTKITLDVEALAPETRHAVEDVDANLQAYRAAVAAKMKALQVKSLPFDDFKDDPTIKPLIEASGHIVKRLKLSDLDNQDVPVPVIMNGKKHLANNSKFIGGALYALSISSHHQLDATQVPPELQEYCTSHVGKANAIHKNMRGLLVASPALAHQYDDAIASCMPEIIEGINKGAHAMQVLNAMKHTDLKVYGDGCKRLLDVIGADYFPAKLESPLECKLVLDSFLTKRFWASHDKNKAVLRKYDPSSPAVDEQALHAIEDMGKSISARDEDSQRQFKLVRDYIVSPRRFADSVARDSGAVSI